jgi:50S ribosomal protein L16 3-hydroxylase
VPEFYALVGSWLSEPKPSVFFTPPPRPPSFAAFRAKAIRVGVRLDPRTQLLFDARHFFVNGDALPWPASGAPTLRMLANARALAGRAISAASPDALRLMYDWHRHGYLHPDAA